MCFWFSELTGRIARQGFFGLEFGSRIAGEIFSIRDKKKLSRQQDSRTGFLWFSELAARTAGQVVFSLRNRF